MCLIVVAHQIHPNYPLLMAANRDEFRQRPTQRMHYWQQPKILAGKDLKGNGTWFGISPNGRWAALTNFRDGNATAVKGASRGELCVRFLQQGDSAISFANTISKELFDGYNILLWDGKELVYFGNHNHQPPQKLAAGIYGLSNAGLDSNWPKVQKVKTHMQKLLQQAVVSHQDLQGLMHDKQIAADHLLPDTGIPLAWEQSLSACFIDAPAMDYGTRTCISLLQDQQEQLAIKERDFDKADSRDQDFAFSLTT